MNSLNTTNRALPALRRGRAKSFLALTGAAFLFAVAATPVALAGGAPTPPAGSIKQTAVASAINYGYGNAIVQVSQNVNNSNIFKPPSKRTPPPSHIYRPPVQRGGVLPFTGAQLTVFVIIGLALLLGGALLRVTSRRNAPSLAGEAGSALDTPAAGSDPLELRTRLAREAARLGGLTNGEHSRSRRDFRAPPR